jgi:hypothetical protein
MKKIFCLIAFLSYTTYGKAQNQLNNNGSFMNNPKLNTQNYSQPTPTSGTNNGMHNSNIPDQSNSMYNNNSQQYNRGNTIKNAVPEGNGTNYTPGAQGINNNNNPGYNSNTRGTINNTSNGAYTLPPNDKK